MTGLISGESIKSQTLYHPKLYPEIARFLEEHSSPKDILFSNLEYGGGIVAVLAHRATSFAMLREVKPYASFDPVAVSRYIIWFKNPQGIYPPFLKGAALLYRLRQVGETELVYLFENPTPLAKRHIVAALVPEWACFGAMGLLIFLMLAEFLRSLKNEKKVDTMTLM
jgi:hypothetical protein